MVNLPVNKVFASSFQISIKSFKFGFFLYYQTSLSLTANYSFHITTPNYLSKTHSILFALYINMHFIMIFIIKAKLEHCCWTEIASICSVYILQCLILKRKMVSIEMQGLLCQEVLSM